MNYYKDPAFTKRNSECANIVACVGEDISRCEYEIDWQPADESVIEGLTMLGIIRGVKYYGYL